MNNTLPDPILQEQSGDPLLDFLIPLLSPNDQLKVSKQKAAALESVANLRSSSLDTIISSSLENSLTIGSDSVTAKLNSLALSSYPQLLQTASSVDTLIMQYSEFEKTSKEFYESQFTYIDQEMHHYLALSTSEDGEKLGKVPGVVSSSFKPSAQPAKTHRRKRSSSILSSITYDNNRLGDQLDDEASSRDLQKNMDDAVILLKNLEKVQDILELPTLIQACVNNGYYAEALDLAAHTARLSQRYEHVKVIQDIQKQVDEVLKSMTVQLLQLLRESVKLPTLIKVISYLRRIPPFSSRSNSTSIHNDMVTHQLQHLFLFSRLQYIRGLLESLDSLKRQSPDMYLKRYIELFREHVFVTVVGFRSVFPDTQISSLETDLPVSQSTAASASPFTQKNTARASDNLIASFIRSLVSDFYQTICDISPFIDDESTRSSLWLQILYCSKSLGRVGADFWPAWQGPEIPKDVRDRFTKDDCDDNDENKEAQAQGPLSKQEWIAAIQKQMDISKYYSQTTAGSSD